MLGLCRSLVVSDTIKQAALHGEVSKLEIRVTCGVDVSALIRRVSTVGSAAVPLLAFLRPIAAAWAVQNDVSAHILSKSRQSRCEGWV